MLRPPGKPYRIAKAVMKNQGIKVSRPREFEKAPLKMPYLQH